MTRELYIFWSVYRLEQKSEIIFFSLSIHIRNALIADKLLFNSWV